MRRKNRKRGVGEVVGKPNIGDEPVSVALVLSPLRVVRTTLPPPPTVKFRRSETCVCIPRVTLSLTLSAVPIPSALYHPVVAASVRSVRGLTLRIQDGPAVR